MITNNNSRSSRLSRAIVPMFQASIAAQKHRMITVIRDNVYALNRKELREEICSSIPAC